MSEQQPHYASKIVNVWSAERPLEKIRVNPPRMEQELAIRLAEDRIAFLTQVEIPVTIVDFYFPVEPRPLLVFVDGSVHHGKSDDEG